MCRLKITEMDLSMTEINTNTLERIIGCCTRLESLSLSGMKLSCAILLGLSYNRRLRQLNLSGCHGFAAPSLGRTLRSCSRIQHLNMSGCPFNHPIAKSIFNNVSSTVTALDLSGKYCYSSLDDLKASVKRCPDIRTLHFNNNWRITIEFLAVLSKLQHLKCLALNGCLGLDLAAITDIKETFPLLKYLRVIPCCTYQRDVFLGGGKPRRYRQPLLFICHRLPQAATRKCWRPQNVGQKNSIEVHIKASRPNMAGIGCSTPATCVRSDSGNGWMEIASLEI
ncbi:S-phase kinase-associated protein 2-like isoform X3 [Phycodurus eques]|uniref:S-phase kinase-associated protein 2-like isoform X3 n=1 Tax=Phycodurus eques TaxID=693459 RepID=UPI002ACD3580|nr:S-phase kinase-associated protein 2-like isoform X3 [Phycodurus eques]